MLLHARQDSSLSLVTCDPLNLSSLLLSLNPDDEIEVENSIKHEDETVPVSEYEVIWNLYCHPISSKEDGYR
ncbi:hypothetical protein Tco_0591278 [Tanacetum coccineum]